MAKYDVEHNCGHTVEHQLFGKVTNRYSKIAWLEKNDCRDCYNKKLAEEKQKKYEENLKNHPALPQLEGSEKQIQWAVSLRLEQIEITTNKIHNNKYHRYFKGNIYPDEYLVDTIEQIAVKKNVTNRDEIDSAIAILRKGYSELVELNTQLNRLKIETSAVYFINNR